KMAQIRSMMASPGVGSFESQETDRDGSIRHVVRDFVAIHEDGRMLRVWGTTRDITGIRQAEQALKQSEMLYRYFFGSAGDGIFGMGGGRWVECNRKGLEICGCSDREQIVGHPPGRFVPERQPDGTESIRLIEERMAAALSGATLSFELRMRKLDGQL